MARELRIGTSGWIYNHWKEIFYPRGMPQRQWFQHYCQTFDTVEINNTFYRLPEAQTFDQWRQQAPAGFLYAVKANRYLTHNLKLKNAADALERLFSRARHLDHTLGPVLYQLPPRWRKNLERLRSFLELLPTDVRHVLEFREQEWLAPDTFALLQEYRVGLCIHDLLPHHPRDVTGSLTYVRFHGQQQPYGGSYPVHHLRSWASWINERRAEVDVFVYFNNDLQGHALRNAQTLRKLVSD